MSKKENFNKNADEAIGSSKADKFGRAGFAIGLAEALIKVPNSQSFTVGLHGAWGSGKTSVIKMSEEYIGKKYQDDVIVLHFNPWVFSSTESLHVALFGTLAKGLGEKLDKDIAVDIAKYAKLTSAAGDVFSVFFPPAGILGKIGAGGLAVLKKGDPKSMSVDSVKTRIDSMLKKSKKRVIVIIDDIDRLDSDEIHLIFKLVKNVAHFSNVSYLLAFDQKVVANALTGRYPDEPEIGGNFVEKIVQLSLFVPPVDPAVLSQYILESINSIADKHKLVVSEEDVSRFQANYSNLLKGLFTTPRKAIRYLNAVDFTLERLANEANFTDVMLVDAIRIFDPDLYSRISSRKSTLIDKGMYSRGEDNQKQAARIEVFGKDDPDPWQDSIIRELFPTYEWALGGSSYSGDYIVEWDEAQRVCSEKYFERYFNYGIPVGDVPDAKLASFIAALSNERLSQDDINKKFKVLVDAGHPNILISKLRNKEKAFDAKVSEKLAIAVVNTGVVLPRQEQSILGDTFSSYVQSSILVVALTRNSGKAFQLMSNFLKKVSIDYSEQLFRWVRADSTTSNNSLSDFTPLFSEEQIKKLGKILAKRIRDYTTTGDLIHDHYDNLASLLWNWNEYGSSKDIQGYIVNAIDSDPKNAIDFLTAYVGNAYDMLTGRKSRSDFRREAYDAITPFLDPEIFVKPLESIFSSEIGNDGGEYPHSMFSSKVPFEKLVAQQFMFIHKSVTKERGDSIDL